MRSSTKPLCVLFSEVPARPSGLTAQNSTCPVNIWHPVGTLDPSNIGTYHTRDRDGPESRVSPTRPPFGPFLPKQATLFGAGWLAHRTTEKMQRSTHGRRTLPKPLSRLYAGTCKPSGNLGCVQRLKRVSTGASISRTYVVPSTYSIHAAVDLAVILTNQGPHPLSPSNPRFRRSAESGDLSPFNSPFNSPSDLHHPASSPAYSTSKPMASPCTSSSF